MTTDIKTVSNAVFSKFMLEVQELIQQGYELDENNLPEPVLWGLCYEAHLIKNDRRAAMNAERVLANAPLKLSREEILAKAREAKKGKREQQGMQQ